MAEYKLKQDGIGEKVINGYKKIGDGVAVCYKKIENRFVDTFLEEVEGSEYTLKTGKVNEKVVSGYKKIEDGVLVSYKKIEKKFVGAFLEEVEEQHIGIK